MLKIEAKDSGNNVDNLEYVEPETWKEIEGYESYLVSNTGRIYSKKSNKELKKWLNNGYPSVQLYKNGRKKNFYIHRLVARSFVPNVKNRKCINHKDGDKTNNNVDNLEWVNYSENHKHAYKNGLKCFKGENHNQSKLTKDDIIEIREKYDKGTSTYKEISEIYGVHEMHIGAIVRRDKWPHVK